MLVTLGCNYSDAQMIAKAIMDFINKGTPFMIGDEDELSRVRDKHGDKMHALKEQRKREMEDLRRKREEERIKRVQEIQAQKVDLYAKR